jgi:hypothetical protein
MVKKILFLLCVMVLVLGLVKISSATQIPGVFSTGVDDLGNLLSYGSVDQHYEILIAPSPIIYNDAVATAEHPLWVPSTSSSQWLTPSGYESTSGSPATAPQGQYLYRLTFDLTGFDPNSAIIEATWATDNNSYINLNNVYTGITKDIYGFTTLTPFSISSGFQSGINYLDFYVYNQPQEIGNPSGLQVNIINASVPEPATMLLLGSGLLGLWGFRKFRKF